MKMSITCEELDQMILERNLPTEFKSEYGIDTNKFDFNHNFGVLQVDELWFEGIHLSYGKWQISKQLEFKAESDSPSIEMHFSLSGTNITRIKGLPFHFDIESNQHNVFYMPHFEGTFRMENPDISNRFFEIHFAEKYFKRFIECGNPLMENFFHAIEKKELCMLNKQNLQITPQMHQLVMEITQQDKKGMLQRLFIESKVLELFMLQLEQFISGKPRGNEISKQDVERLHHARYLIEQNIHKPYSLKALSRAVGLNDFKLKKGFRSVFNTTVFGYVYELRMREAKRLLLERQKNIWEIADYCGYANANHFSTAFRRKYGTSPSKYLRT